MRKQKKSSNNPVNFQTRGSLKIFFFLVLLSITAGSSVTAAPHSDEAAWRSCLSGKIFEILPAGEGKSIIAATSSSAFFLSVENGALINTIPRNDTYVNNNQKISYDGTYIVRGGWNYNNFEFQSLGGNHPQTEWKYPLGQTLTDIEISADSSTIAVASYDNDLHLLTRSGDLLWKRIGKSFIRKIRITSDGSRLAALSQNGNISFFSHREGYLWDISFGSPVTDFGLSPNGRFLIMGLADQTIQILTDDAQRTSEMIFDNPVKYVSVSNNGKQFAAVLANNTILYYNQSQSPVWAFSSDIPISSVSIIQEKVIFGDVAGCVYSVNNNSVFHMPYQSPRSPVVGKEQTSATITTSTTIIPSIVIKPPENSGIAIPQTGIEFLYYLVIGMLLIGVIIQGWKVLKRKRHY